MPELTAGRLLGQVAQALNACQEAGMPARLRHGIVMTGAGYVLPAGDGEWVARTLRYSPFSPAGGPGEDP